MGLRKPGERLIRNIGKRGGKMWTLCRDCGERFPKPAGSKCRLCDDCWAKARSNKKLFQKKEALING